MENQLEDAAQQLEFLGEIQQSIGTSAVSGGSFLPSIAHTLTLKVLKQFFQAAFNFPYYFQRK